MRLAEDTPVLVTGGGSGLGAGTVAHLRGLGCPVVSLDLDSPTAHEQAATVGAHFEPCDVTDATMVSAAVAAAAERSGAPRALINCAGIAPAARTVSRQGPHDPELFAHVVAVNLTGTFLVLSQVAAIMSQSAPLADGERGVIINTASVAAFDGQIGQAAYAASKAGVSGMTLPLARDLASLGIRVCAIAPGIFRTPMVQAMPPEVRDNLAARIPFPKRLGAPADFAMLVRHIIENPMLNGEVIRLDGAIRMGPR